MSANTRRIVASDALNDLVARYPRTLPLLTRRGLDTCCGGAVSLSDAAAHHGLDLDELLEAVNAAADGGR